MAVVDAQPLAATAVGITMFGDWLLPGGVLFDNDGVVEQAGCELPYE